ncbi:Histone deacetylase [Arachis hypogaea]|nr:Histone deacetylase [Arachis hypogaea]
MSWFISGLQKLSLLNLEGCLVTAACLDSLTGDTDMITTALQSCCDVILIVAKTLLQCVEVKPGDCVKIDELEVANAYIHISQVALGEASKNEKSKEPVDVPGDFGSDDYSESDEKEAALNFKDNAKKVNVAVPKKDEEDEDSDGDDDDDDDDEFDDEDESGSEMDADSDEDGSDEDEETPVKKVDQGKKRPNVSATKTPVPAAKKAKNVTPEKSGGKKIAHAPTPHPVKKGGNPNSAGKFQSPKTGSQQQKKGGKKGGH